MHTHLIVVLTLYSLIYTSASIVTAATANFTKDNVTKILNFTLVEEVKTKLTNHIWELDGNVLLFSKQGIVSQVVDKQEVHKSLWEVYIEENEAYLRLLGSDEEITYQLSGSTFKNWVVLSTNEAFSVNAIPISANSTMTTTMQKLAGTWNSTIYPSNLIENLTGKDGNSVKSASFRYQIRQNGTFRKSIYLNEIIHQEVEGIWQISSDGKYFILHFDRGNRGFQTYIAAIKHLSFDELVLNQALATSDLELRLCSQLDTFFFNRT